MGGVRGGHGEGKLSGDSGREAGFLFSAGELLILTGDTVGQWKEHFEDLLNLDDMPSKEEVELEDLG